MRRWRDSTALRIATTLGCALASACNSLGSTVVPPVNACAHDSDCRLYGSSPRCSAAGNCLVTASAPNLALVVLLPTTSAFAPGATFAIDYNHIYDPLNAVDGGVQGCDAGSCALLPNVGTVQGAYLISPSAAQQISFPLGNRTNTALPAQAIFRLLWPPGAGPAGMLTEALALPVEPGQGIPIPPPSNLLFPGPAGGPQAPAFQLALPPGSYQLVLRPSRPFDQAFGPEVLPVSVVSGSSPPLSLASPVIAFNFTMETDVGSAVPAFDISRNDGLDGWTASLRDRAGLTISNVAPLSSTKSHVVLATFREGVADALAGAVLVIAPPVGQNIPTAVFPPIGNVLPAAEVYPELPPPVLVQGIIEDNGNGSPVAADLVFAAVGITDLQGALNTNNFELVARIAAQPTAPGGPCAFAITIPQGSYRVTVVPRDPLHQLSTVPLDVGPSPPGLDVAVAAPHQVGGIATIADGRPLAGAEVEATGVACTVGNFSWCLPRTANTVTGSDGSFMLSLDPGQYSVAVRPADGTVLPWVLRSVLVGSTDDPPPPSLAITVPAPASAGIRLVDPGGNPVVSAVVRAFSVPPGGPATEIGRSLTDTNGHFDLYVAPPVP
jgi:hypothetical protein